MSENKNKVNLTNVGFASFFIKRERAKAIPSWDMTKKQITFSIERQSEYKYFHKGRQDVDFKNYFSRLKEVIKRNPIQDTDKVFFTKNSLYPRTSFNRYSTKARRVELTTTATKQVINADFQPYLGYNREIVTNNFCFQAYHIVSCISTLIRNAPSSVLSSISDPLVTKFIRNENAHYQGHNEVLKVAIQMFERELKETLVKEEEYTEVNFSTIPDRETFEILCEGLPIDIFVDDVTVNKYIDQFKTKLDASSYKILLTSLTAGENNVTIGLKLLENMNVHEGKAYLYSLFIQAMDKNSSNLKYNNNWNSVAMKNIRAAYDLNLITNEDYSNRDKIALAEKVYKDHLNTSEDRELFREIIDEFLHKKLKDLLGPGPYNFLYLKQEEDEDN